ncbi:MAG: prepilin-type N-terminal cleavage/methylation domain-containing protein, partial [Verrucomicrobiota bacterium]
MVKRNQNGSFKRAWRGRAFTLIEVLVATSILMLLMLMIFSIVGSTGKLWKETENKVGTFKEVRAALETINRRLSQATLNAYYDAYSYDEKQFCTSVTPTAVPQTYFRRSDLHFISGRSSDLLHQTFPSPTHCLFFQAYLGFTENPSELGSGELNAYLNSCGYYIEYGKDSSLPLFLQKSTKASLQRYRYRLMEFLEPTEKMSVYETPADSSPMAQRWFSNKISNTSHPYSRVLAENVIAFIVFP